MNNNVGGDYDRLTDWIGPHARGLAIQLYIIVKRTKISFLLFFFQQKVGYN